MNLGEGVADLHVHTTASDGTNSVSERIQQAADRELEAIALTDHDCIVESRTDRRTNSDDVEVITGVEIRADVRGTKVEILGYYVEPAADTLVKVLERTRHFRRERNRALIMNVREQTSLDVDYESLAASTDGMLGRPHVAEALLEAGVVDSIGEAFETYLGSNGSAFVPMERLPAERVVAAIHDAGGVASLAHPGRIRANDVPTILEKLVSSGLDAIEVKYPYDEAPSEGYAAVDSEDAGKLADEFELLTTGGSDCHGTNSGKFRIGDVRIKREQLERVRQRANEREPLGQ